jgi:hypothetical protein
MAIAPTAAKGLPVSIAPAAALAVRVALEGFAAPVAVFLHVRQRLLATLSPVCVPPGPGAIAELSPPGPFVMVDGASVAVSDPVSTAASAVAVQTPVTEGTAFEPEEMATRLVPQLAACARWRFRLSWS